MSPATIHLSTTRLFQTHHAGSRSDEIINAFVQSCLKLDACIFESFMEEEEVFEDKDKYLFLASLKNLFDEIRNNDSLFYSVKVTDDSCRGCSLGKPVKIFSYKGFGKYITTGKFGYLVEMEDGILKDIYRCNLI